MKKLINDPLRVVEDMLEGMVAADDQLTLLEGHNVVVAREHERHVAAGRVAVISGGGAGHEPAHAGYVGEGMLTAAVVGNVFTSPSVDAVLAALHAVTGPAGALLIVKNYTGDRLNFGLAAELARADGLRVEMIVVGDDVSLEPEAAVGRRGLAGVVWVHKIAGAAAAEGLPLAAVASIAASAGRRMFTMGLGLGPCIVPAAGKAGFMLGAHDVEYGLGIHGERGAFRRSMEDADTMVDAMVDSLMEHSGLEAGERVAVMVNNLGGTAIQELSIVMRRVLARLAFANVAVDATMSGTFLSALEMPGCSISVLRLDPVTLDRLMAPTTARGWTPPARSAASAVPRMLQASQAPAGRDRKIGPSWAQRPEGDAFAQCIAAVATAVRDAEDMLTALDAVVGDGDIGLSLTRGASAIGEALPTLDTNYPASTIATLSAIVRRVVGGTSGPLYAMLLLRAAGSLAGASHPGSVSAWQHALRAGIEGVQDLGGARAGDRTMLDALVPAWEALTAAAARGDRGPQAARAAALAAQAGAEATRDMAPRLGRSSYLGERTRGHPDPGAVAVAVWVTAIATALDPSIG